MTLLAEAQTALEASISFKELVIYGIGAVVALVGILAKRVLGHLETSVATMTATISEFSKALSDIQHQISVLDGEDARRERHLLRNQVNALMLWRATLTRDPREITGEHAIPKGGE